MLIELEQIRPDKRSFFKYSSPETALAILKSKSIRFSSPLLFNDPFDVQSGLHFDFDIETLSSKINDRLEKLVCANTSVFDEKTPLGEVIRILRDQYSTYGFDRKSWDSMTSDLFNEFIDQIKALRLKYQNHWDVLLPGLRIFSISEEKDNLLMWAHYSKDHTGVVFEFLSLPEEDNALSVAQPVIYVHKPIPFFTEEEYIEKTFSMKGLNVTAFHKRYALTKSKHWEYEREWRVWYPSIPDAVGLYTDVSINPSEFASIYIGCRAKPEFEASIIELTLKSFPSTRIYRACKSKAEYALKFEEILYT